MPRFVAAALLSVTIALAAAAQDQPQTQPATPPAGTYQLDPAHASIGFVVSHLGISEIAGRFNDVAGEVTLGEEPRFEATMQTASVDTGVEKRDDHLRSDDFFHVEEHPTITFRSTDVEVDGNTYRVTGDFTMNGQTHSITLPLRYLGSAEFHGQRVGFAGETTIDRREWGLDAWQGGLVGNDVRLVISFEAVQPAPAQE